jgi:hypothetical protein
MKYTSKHWAITIRILDLLVVALVLSIAWLTWSLYRQSGVVRMPLDYSSVLCIPVFLALRGVAKREKKKAEDAQAKDLADGKIPK